MAITDKRKPTKDEKAGRLFPNSKSTEFDFGPISYRRCKRGNDIVTTAARVVMLYYRGSDLISNWFY